MRGREPIGDRAAERFKLFVVLEGAIFLALVVIFIADFVHDYQEDMERFVMRLIAYQALALVAAIIATVLVTLRSHTWEAADGVLLLHNWGELSGEHEVVRLRVQHGQRGKPYLEAVLAVGEVARLSRGDEARLKVLKTRLTPALLTAR